jgi:hypothetical protein
VTKIDIVSRGADFRDATRVVDFVPHGVDFEM